MTHIRITDPDDPRIADYRNVPDPQLLREGSVFVAENRLVVRVLLASRRFRTRSVLVNDAALDGLADVLASVDRTLPVYVCATSLLQSIAGFNVHRGCLALGERPAAVPVKDLLTSAPAARRLVVLEGMTNADNVGGVFRNARAFGIDAIVLGPRCCDPLYRKAIRVSIGASLVVPFATVAASDWPSALAHLKREGFVLAALTPAADAVDLARFADDGLPEKIAVLAGNEGEGLAAGTQAAADVRLRIAMAPGVDSLNASTATGIALHRLRVEVDRPVASRGGSTSSE